MYIHFLLTFWQDFCMIASEEQIRLEFYILQMAIIHRYLYKKIFKKESVNYGKI